MAPGLEASSSSTRTATRSSSTSTSDRARGDRLTPTELIAIDRGAFLEALTGQPRDRALADAESTRRLDADLATGVGGQR
jgi:hypothetical protein